MILGVTNSAAEFDRMRSSDTVIRGVGCHPSDASAVAQFDRASFAARAGTTALVGEIGLDGASLVPSVDQRRVCAEVLDVVRTMPRLVSLHSVRAHGPLLDLIHSASVPGAILHWWTGSRTQTARAVDLGCWFSIGPGMLRQVDRLAQFPRDRVLSETDAPVRGAVAGRVDDVEGMLATVWSCDIEEVRRQIWQNFAALVALTRTHAQLPVVIQKVVAEAARHLR